MSADALRYLAAALVFVVAGVHYQQYIDSLSQVDTVGTLFLLNAAGGAALVVLLVQRDHVLRMVGALGSIPLCAGSLVSILLAMGGGVFGYQEPDWRTSVIIAVVAEVGALLAAAAYVAAARRTVTA